MERYEVRLSGSGGQGIITAGIILAEAAGVYEGKEVCQTQAYGPEARGGASKAEVVISDSEIDYPKVIKPDIVLAMNQQACDTYCYDLKPGGLLIIDATLVKDIPIPWVIALPFTQIARQEFGKEMVANIVALGALVKISGVVSLESLEMAVLARAPTGTAELNRQALASGVAAAEQLLSKRLPHCLEEAPNPLARE
ncbi:2-oxoacid:acceptor oxidoreductase family protein [Desulfobacca acetoxidans]